MKAYPDASLIVSALSKETMTEAAIQWFAEYTPGELVSSRWCLTETASALAIKVRTGVLPPHLYGTVVDASHDLLRNATVDVPVRAGHFDMATNFIRRSVKPLRGGDALHLAIAADAGATLWTLDGPMTAAGQALGLDVRRLD